MNFFGFYIYSFFYGYIESTIHHGKELELDGELPETETAFLGSK